MTEKAKYYKVNFPFGDCGVSEIKDDEELKIWLNDTSLEDGDLVIEAVELYVVEEDKTITRRLRPLESTVRNEK